MNKHSISDQLVADSTQETRKAIVKTTKNEIKILKKSKTAKPAPKLIDESKSATTATIISETVAPDQSRASASRSCLDASVQSPPKRKKTRQTKVLALKPVDESKSAATTAVVSKTAAPDQSLAGASRSCLDASVQPPPKCKKTRRAKTTSSKSVDKSISAAMANTVAELSEVVKMEVIKETPLEKPAITEESETDKNILFHEPYISDNYNETYLYALPCGPRSIYCFWEISSGAKDYLRHRFGDNFFQNNYLILRLRRVGERHSWDIEDFLDQKNSYWLTVNANTEYEIELGYRSRDAQSFERVAQFKNTRTPPEIENKHESQNEWREVKVPSFGKELKVTPADWRFNYYEYWKKNKVVNKPAAQGCWALVLHMHLPFVRHLEYPVALEEQWLFEAITSCYAPLLNMFWNLERDKVDFRIAISISPPLISMLTDPALQDRYRLFLKETISLAERELNAHRHKTYQHTIETILNRLHTAQKVFEAYSGNILTGFKDFQEIEKVEIMTCPGTHAILPYYAHYPEMARGHIQLACRQYQRIFGRWPRGAWLPENAFTPGLDNFLIKEGIQWTLVNSTALTRGNTRVWYDTKRPIITHNGLAIFGIDEDTRAQVWSREAGYPGDARYKEWYRDIGYDMNWDHLPPYWKVGNTRRNTGIKYFRITSKNTPLHEKQPYNPEWAQQAVNEQASQFVCHRGAQARHFHNRYHIQPFIVSAYDAELFGHWWEEGPAWIETVFRKMLYDQSEARPCSPSEFLHEEPRHQLLMPGMSTWGKKATFETWLDGRAFQPNVWIYRHLFRQTENMIRLATEKTTNASELERRAMNQAARELMLAQASDWPFLISMSQCARYAEVRLIKHIDRCKELIRQVDAKSINAQYLRALENADTLLNFDMDYRVFCRGV